MNLPPPNPYGGRKPGLSPNVARGVGTGCAFLILAGVTVTCVAFLIWLLQVLL